MPFPLKPSRCSKVRKFERVIALLRYCVSIRQPAIQPNNSQIGALSATQKPYNPNPGLAHPSSLHT